MHSSYNVCMPQGNAMKIVTRGCFPPTSQNSNMAADSMATVNEIVYIFKAGFKTFYEQGGC